MSGVVRSGLRVKTQIGLVTRVVSDVVVGDNDAEFVIIFLQGRRLCTTDVAFISSWLHHCTNGKFWERIFFLDTKLLVVVFPCWQVVVYVRICGVVIDNVVVAAVIHVVIHVVVPFGSIQLA